VPAFAKKECGLIKFFGTKSDSIRLIVWREKMKCTKIRKLISSYIDDQLGPDEKNDFVSHIRNCPGCRKALEEVQTVHELFTSAERFSVPYGFTTRVMANLEAKEPSRWWAFFTHRPLVLRTLEVAFALIVVMIGVISGNLLIADNVTTKQSATIQESFSLDLFQATPSGSIGGVFVKLVGATDEK
jgi:predicted anti-sigma-YlaC factor YlaD